MSQTPFIKIGQNLVNLSQISGITMWAGSGSIGIRIVGMDSAITLHGWENDEFREQFQRAIDAGFVRVFEGDSK